jgi:hypothetical protein
LDEIWRGCGAAETESMMWRTRLLFRKPAWTLVLRADARETMCADLLEEYREVRIPRLGQVRADFWC